jgi:CDP-glucose 4,6-dehydratase
MNPAFWRGRRVFLTGHTGFKGGWLSLWLAQQGAKVSGFSLAPAAAPNFFETARVGEVLVTHETGDIRDAGLLARAMARAEPEIVFHLAAQSLVRPSYAAPVETYATNVMGTVHLLEAARGIPGIAAIVNVTSDKCYENRETAHRYAEDDAMGGYDPYSSSKGAAELVSAAYRRSYFSEPGPALASARAGNVIGGGDWAEDRLVPDFFRALDEGKPLVIRSPHAVRPWQHVLEPLSGYLRLAEMLAEDGGAYAGGWNFGPDAASEQTVGFVADELARRMGGTVEIAQTPQPHEAGLLRLNSAKARTKLGWTPRWTLETALARTADWHRAWRAHQDMHAFSLDQIAVYAAGRN